MAVSKLVEYVVHCHRLTQIDSLSEKLIDAQIEFSIALDDHADRMAVGRIVGEISTAVALLAEALVKASEDGVAISRLDVHEEALASGQNIFSHWQALNSYYNGKGEAFITGSSPLELRKTLRKLKESIEDEALKRIEQLDDLRDKSGKPDGAALPMKATTEGPLVYKPIRPTDPVDEILVEEWRKASDAAKHDGRTLRKCDFASQNFNGEFTAKDISDAQARLRAYKSDQKKMQVQSDPEKERGAE